MSNLIIIRLHPAEPMSGAEFTNVLNGLTITAFDLTFGDSVGGVNIGTASGLADPHLGSTTNNNVNVNNKSILQHYRNVSIGLPPVVTRHLEAAATAVIVVNAPAGHPEYPTADSFDIRMELKRGSLDIFDKTPDYTVKVT